MVFGLFSKEKSLQRTIDKATNKLAQQADRWSAMERLREDGSEGAIFGLCKRWGITSSVGVQDEQEKAWVVDVMVEIGANAIEPMRRWVKTAAHLSYPLEALGRLINRETGLEMVDQILADEPPGYTRDPERRLDVLRWLNEWSKVTSEDIVPRMIPYLEDFDENVRWATADGLSHHEHPEIGPALVKALIRPEEQSGRVRRRIAEILAEKQVPLGDDVDKVKDVLVGPVAAFEVKDGVLNAK